MSQMAGRKPTAAKPRYGAWYMPVDQWKLNEDPVRYNQSLCANLNNNLTLFCRQVKLARQHETTDFEAKFEETVWHLMLNIISY